MVSVPVYFVPREPVQPRGPSACDVLTGYRDNLTENYGFTVIVVFK